MSKRPSSARRRGLAAFAASGVSLTASFAVFGPAPGTASSHREAPLTAADPAIDNTDVYAFVSPDAPDSVTLIANWVPFQEPNGGPNFYPFSTDARFDINIDNNGDAKPDVTYRWRFATDDKRGTDTFLYNNGPVKSIDDPTLLFRQTYTLEQLDGEGNVTKTLAENAKVAPSRVGAASMPDYEALRDEAITEVEGGKTFAGQADDPFFLDLRVFDLLYGTDLSEAGQDSLSGYNVNSIALQVPKADVVSKGDPVIGVWSTTSRPSVRTQNADGTQSYDGELVQVSRLGNPLVNEVVIPTGLKDAFNSLTPDKDATVQAAVDRVNDPEVPKLIEKIYGIKAPAAPRDDLFAIFLTGVKGLNMPKGKVQPAELLRLNTSIAPSGNPNRLAVLAKDNAGFPNGRRLTDDVVDIEIQALEGAVRTGKIVEPLAKGDGVNANDVEFGSSFPYIALPHDSGVNIRAQVKGTKQNQSGTAPQGGVAAGGGGTAGTSNGRGFTTQAAAVLLAVVGAGLATTGARTLRRAKATR